MDLRSTKLATESFRKLRRLILFQPRSALFECWYFQFRSSNSNSTMHVVFWTKMIHIQGPTVNYFGVLKYLNLLHFLLLSIATIGNLGEVCFGMCVILSCIEFTHRILIRTRSSSTNTVIG